MPTVSATGVFACPPESLPVVRDLQSRALQGEVRRRARARDLTVVEASWREGTSSAGLGTRLLVEADCSPPDVVAESACAAAGPGYSPPQKRSA